MKKNKVLACALAAALLVGVPATNLNAAVNFSDVSRHWARELIEKYIDAGVVEGYSDGTFKPDDPLTRAECVALLNRSFNIEETGFPTFTDVKSGDWFYSDIGAAQERKYVSGYADGSFKPNNKVTCLEALIMLHSLLGKPEYTDFSMLSGLADFNTIPKDKQSYSQIVAFMLANKIIAAYPDETIRVTRNITRAEMLALIDNVGEMITNSNAADDEEEGVTPTPSTSITPTSTPVPGEAGSWPSPLAPGYNWNTSGSYLSSSALKVDNNSRVLLSSFTAFNEPPQTKSFGVGDLLGGNALSAKSGYSRSSAAIGNSAGDNPSGISGDDENYSSNGADNYLSGLNNANDEYSSGFDNTNDNYSSNINVARNRYSLNIGNANDNYPSDMNTANDNYSSDINTADDNYSSGITSVNDNYSSDMNTANDNYSSGINTANDNYSSDMNTANDNYSSGINTANDNYSSDINNTNDNYSSGINTANDNYSSGTDTANDNYPSGTDTANDNYPSGTDTANDNYPSGTDTANDNYPSGTDTANDNYPSGSDNTNDNYPSGSDNTNDNPSSRMSSPTQNTPAAGLGAQIIPSDAFSLNGGSIEIQENSIIISDAGKAYLNHEYTLPKGTRLELRNSALILLGDLNVTDANDLIGDRHSSIIEQGGSLNIEGASPAKGASDTYYYDAKNGKWRAMK